MAELADATDSKSVVREDLRVRLPPKAFLRGVTVAPETLNLFVLVRIQAKELRHGRPIGRVNRLKICVVWVRVPPVLFAGVAQW